MSTLTRRTLALSAFRNRDSKLRLKYRLARGMEKVHQLLVLITEGRTAVEVIQNQIDFVQQRTTMKHEHC